MQQAKILMVDDLPANLLALRKLIEQDDRQIFEACSGAAALSLCLEHEFAIAFLDVMMPEMDGFELAGLMRGTAKTRTIPIVFVTAANQDLKIAFKGYQTGAVDLLHKPLNAVAVQSKASVFVSLFQQRKEAERQVAALEVSQRELREAQRDLHRAVGMRDEFMSLVAHELRTPLNTLFIETQLRTTQLDRGNLAAFSKENLGKMLARDMRQVNSMIRLINDMVDVARVRSGQLSLRRINGELAALLHRVVEDLRHHIDSVGGKVELDVPNAVHGTWDEFRIEQIILNLLTNALRYGGTETISVSLRSDDGSACIIVRDRGQGIAAEDLDRIFAPFERVGSNQVREGLGLGLYIARQLATSHSGTLTVESSLGRGAAFKLVFPLAPPNLAI